MRKAALLLCATLQTMAMAPPALAQTTPPLLQMPGRWASTPTSQQLENARPAGVTGRGYVDMLCQVRADLSLSACAIVTENPPDLGFGKAALSLADDYRIADPDFPIPGASFNTHVWVAWPGDSGPCYPPNCVGIPAPRR